MSDHVKTLEALADAMGRSINGDAIRAILKEVLEGNHQSIDYMCHLNRIVADLLEENKRLRAENKLRRRIIDRLPLCPDHRDKHHADDCLSCRIEAALACLNDPYDPRLERVEAMAQALRGES
jgi:hypothetical protein